MCSGFHQRHRVQEAAVIPERRRQLGLPRNGGGLRIVLADQVAAIGPRVNAIPAPAVDQLRIQGRVATAPVRSST